MLFNAFSMLFNAFVNAFPCFFSAFQFFLNAADFKIGVESVLKNGEINVLGPLIQDPLGPRLNRKLAQASTPPGGV